MKSIKSFHKRRGIVLLQITESTIKVIKATAGRQNFVAVETVILPNQAQDSFIIARLKEVFKKIGYHDERVIMSLACHQATHRYIKLPTQVAEEIEKIITFQAPKYLPYSVEELVTGYHVIRVDKDGYSHVNLIIAPREISQRYCAMAKELGCKDFAITLSSYGLAYLYDYIVASEKAPLMIVDIDGMQVELAIVAARSVLLSRSFKLTSTVNVQTVLFEEIQKTNSAYLKETQQQAISHIVILGTKSQYESLASALYNQYGYKAQFLSYEEKIPCSDEFRNSIRASKNSFAHLIGLALHQVPDTLNLVPRAFKDASRSVATRRERIRTALLLIAILVMFAFAVNKSLDNKSHYRDKLRAQLLTLTKDAKPLEDLEKRVKLLHNRPQKKPTVLEVLYELHRIVPDKVFLVVFTYEEDTQVLLRGQTPELNNVFALVSSIEKSTALRNFNVKVKYATKRKTSSGEIVDFEIACVKGK